MKEVLRGQPRHQSLFEPIFSTGFLEQNAFATAIALERSAGLGSTWALRYWSHSQFLRERGPLRSVIEIVPTTAFTLARLGLILGEMCSNQRTSNVAASTEGPTASVPLRGVFFLSASQQCWLR